MLILGYFFLKFLKVILLINFFFTFNVKLFTDETFIDSIKLSKLLKKSSSGTHKFK